MDKVVKPLVVVEWWDANTGTDDVIDDDNIDAYHKPTRVTTLGWLIKRDELGVTVCNEHYDNSYRGRTFIYAPMIISVTPSKLSKPRAKIKPTDEPADRGVDELPRTGV